MSLRESKAKTLSVLWRMLCEDVPTREEGLSVKVPISKSRDVKTLAMKDPLKLLMWKMDTCESPKEPGYQILWNAYNHLKYRDFNGKIHFDTKSVLKKVFQEEQRDESFDFAGAIRASE